MLVQNPFKIEYLDDPKAGVRELHFTFTGLFKAMGLEQRVATFEAYINQLVDDAKSTDDLANREGIITIIQISQQLYPHLQANEIPLDETLIVEMGDNAEGSSLAELLNGSGLN
ncbi:MAG: transcriptional regulator [Gammaproteobacteria bacterium]|nr:transcriptional regulator [Gammaproteobacteria bacterium]